MFLLLHKCPQSVGPQHRPSLEDIRPYHDGAFCPSASAGTGNAASKAARITPFISLPLHRQLPDGVTWLRNRLAADCLGRHELLHAVAPAIAIPVGIPRRVGLRV